MRTNLSLFLLVLLASSAAQAAPPNPQCLMDGKAWKPPAEVLSMDQVSAPPTNCFAGEVFILDGKETFAGKPIVSCEVDKMGVENPKSCKLGDTFTAQPAAGVEAAAKRALELMREQGAPIPAGGWDEIVVFTADIGPAKDPAGPLFFRAKNADGLEIMPVKNLGLPAVPRDPAVPYVGLIDAGNTKTIGGSPWSGTYGPCGRATRRATDAPVAADHASAAVCAPAVYNYFDALAQATARLYGPYLQGDAAWGGDWVTMPTIKKSLVNAPPGSRPSPKIGGTRPTIWNSLLNTKGSLLGGNTFRNNANNTYDVTKPPTYYDVASTTMGATLRFTAMDLYVLGLMPSTEVGEIESFMRAKPDANVQYPPGLLAWGDAVGPTMGVRTGGVSIRGTRGVPEKIPFTAVVAANGGERSPSAQESDHVIRQLWVLVTKPAAKIQAVAESNAKGDAAKLPLEIQKQYTDMNNQIINVQKYRQEWGRYFFRLTGWRGRVLTTFDAGTDDVPYWEFGARDLEKHLEKVGGINYELRLHENINLTNEKKTVLRLDTGGEQDGLRIKGTFLPLRIEGGQEGGAPHNFITVRMRVPEDRGLLTQLTRDFKAKKASRQQVFMRILFEGPGGANAEVLLPSLPAEAFLIPDGRFRNYSANLSDAPGFNGGTFTSFTLFPSTRAMEGLEIEFIRLSNTGTPKDTDKSCKGKEQPDGWVDSEDNCPTVFNPFQEDGNLDGRGDACEDYDGDNVINICDSCPTLTNSRQRDRDKDGRGDICDDEGVNSGCVFQPNSMAGPVAATSTAWLKATALLAAAMFAINLRRRSRRRR